MEASLESPPPRSESTRHIALRGVRVHNLRQIDLDLPLGQFVAITGVSGSGKSSLVRDTLLAEGRRRFLETLSPSLRQQLERIERPEADRLAGIPPTLFIASDDIPPRQWLRGTVASVTEIHELLGVWFSRLGQVYCPTCGHPVRPGTPAVVLDLVRQLPDGLRLQVAFDWVADPAAEWLGSVDDLVRMGYRRIIADSVTRPLSVGTESLPDVGVVVLDRLTVGASPESRLLESSEAAFHASSRGCRLLVAAEPSVEALLPGAQSIDIDGQPWWSLRIPPGWTCGSCNRSLPALEPRLFRFWQTAGACPRCGGAGVVAESDTLPCTACSGSGLREEALAVRWGSVSLADWLSLSTADLLTAVEDARPSLGDSQLTLVRPTLDELTHRLRMLELLGLSSLPLDRRIGSLAEGERQRLRWMSLLGPKLTGTLVLLDEPTATCQPADLKYLLAGVRELLTRRNSVIAVDHVLEFVSAADHAVELGPGPGAAGGRLVFQGTPAALFATPSTALARALEERTRIVSEPASRRRRPTGWLTAPHLTIHGVPQPGLRVPLGVLAVVTGACGSGKTEWLIRQLPGYGSADLCEISGDGEAPERLSLAALEVVDQTPLSRSPRATPVTWLGAFDEIRDVFAETAEAKQRGWTARYFSWQTADGGRCRQCRGTGVLKLNLEFLAEVTSVCPECQGRRFRREAIEVKYRGRSIADVLEMTVEEAATFFRSQSRLQQKFQWLKTAGLGYLVLGQPAATLSGGEAQRLKLASRLASGTQRRSLFLCDQPARGLHPLDVPALVRCLQDLVAIGHSVVLIDHTPELLFAADLVLELTGDAKAGKLQTTALSPEKLEF